MNTMKNEYHEELEPRKTRKRDTKEKKRGAKRTCRKKNQKKVEN
jgi:hypothetical protein